MSALQTLPAITTLEEYDALPEDIRAEVLASFPFLNSYSSMQNAH